MLLGDIFRSESESPPRLGLVDKIRREISLYKAEHVATVIWIVITPLKWWSDR